MSLSKAQNESLAKMAGERKRTPRALTQCQTHTARGAPGSRTARGPAHGVPCIGVARVQTAFSTSRTSEVHADLRMGES